MPNHVTTEVKIDGTQKEIDKFFKLIKTNYEGEDIFDFDNILPMPEELRGTRSPMKIISEEEYEKQEKEVALITRQIAEKKEAGIELTKEEKAKEDFGFSRNLTQELSDKYLKEFGADNWYDWRIKHWGTKWGAYDANFGDDWLTFQTAWSHPTVIMLLLGQKFPKLRFEIRFADEDFGYNLAEYVIEGGNVIEENVPKGGSPEAYKLALDIQGGEDYYLGDRLCEADEDELENDFIKTLIELAVERNYICEDMPIYVLEKAKEIAIEGELFEQAKEITEFIENKK